MWGDLFPFLFYRSLTFKVEDILVVCPATLSKDNSSPLLSLEPSTISLKAPEISPFCEQVGGWGLVPVYKRRRAAKLTFPRAYIKVFKIPDSGVSLSLSGIIYMVIEMAL